MILQDHLAGGQWHWCRACGIGGDLIELAARVWQLSVPATIAKLRSKGFPIPATREDTRIYLEQHIANRKRLRDLWETARQQYIDGSTDAMRLVQTLRLDCQVPFERLTTGMGRMVGGLTADKVQEALLPQARENLFKSSKTEKWRGVVTIPFYDLPERICGFLFVGRKARRDKDYVFKRTNIATRVGQQKAADHIKEGGLSMHPGIFDASTEWGGVLFCLADPVRALQLHARHLAVSLRPLPIISWYPSDALNLRYSWQMFAGKKLIIWAPKLTHNIIQQAVRTGAKVSTIGPRDHLEEDLDQYIWRRTTEELLHEIHDSARPWPQVVAKHFDSLGDTDLEDLLMQLRLSGVDLSKLLRRCPKKLGHRLTAIINQQPVGRTIGMENKVVVERDGGWYLEGARAGQWELIMDAQLRIDYVIRQPRTDRTLYQGRLLCQGEEFPFCADRETLERKHFKFLDDLVLDHGKSITYVPKWGSRLVSIARQFHSPQILTGVETVGWDLDRMAFVLPKYRIEVGGKVSKNKGIFPAGAPGEQFDWPEALSGQELHELLLAEKPNAMLWAAITSAVANILAPAFHQHTAGVATVGAAMSDIAKAVTDDFGCLSHKLSGNAGSAEKLRTDEREHNWPIHVAAIKVTKSLATFIDEKVASNPHHNCIVPLDWHTATLQRLVGGWHVLESADVGGVPPETRAILRRFVPAYLQDLANRRLRRPDEDSISGNGIWWEAVLEDLASYLKRFGVDGARVFEAREVYANGESGDHGDARALADFTSQLVKEGKCVNVPEGFQDDKTLSVLRMENDELAIPKSRLVEFVASRYHILLDREQISAVLSKAGVLRQDLDDCWVVPEAWWMARMKQTQNAQTGLLRIRA